MNPLKVILASASPRRQQFLNSFQIPHTVASADIDETPHPGEAPLALAARLAAGKAMAVGKRLAAAQKNLNDQRLIIGADTVVALGEEVLGKPEDEEDAFAMLARLRSRPHQVHSAVAVAYFVAGHCRQLVSQQNTTTVIMRGYTDAEIIDYIATGDPFDKAGGYGIQHRGFDPVCRLHGCPAGVMGLPAADLLALLAAFGVVPISGPAAHCPVLTGFPCCQQTDIQRD